MVESVVSDTGPIIHLWEADALELLDQFDSLHVPEQVYEELAVGTVPMTSNRSTPGSTQSTSTSTPRSIPAK
jgi:predicted nucleic acid-binding protein